MEFKRFCKFGSPLRQNGKKKEAKLSAGENTEQLELSYTCWKQCQLENSLILDTKSEHI